VMIAPPASLRIVRIVSLLAVRPAWGSLVAGLDGPSPAPPSPSREKKAKKVVKDPPSPCVERLGDPFPGIGSVGHAVAVVRR
jgi:hypothetical protein